MTSFFWHVIVNMFLKASSAWHWWAERFAISTCLAEITGFNSFWYNTTMPTIKTRLLDRNSYICKFVNDMYLCPILFSRHYRYFRYRSTQSSIIIRKIYPTISQINLENIMLFRIFCKILFCKESVRENKTCYTSKWSMKDLYFLLIENQQNVVIQTRWIFCPSTIRYRFYIKCILFI